MESFTSLPPHEEQTFAVYEERMLTTSKSANTLGWGIAGAVFALIVFAVLAGGGGGNHPTGFEEPTEAASAPAK